MWDQRTRARTAWLSGEDRGFLEILFSCLRAALSSPALCQALPSPCPGSLLWVLDVPRWLQDSGDGLGPRSWGSGHTDAVPLAGWRDGA